MAFIGRGPTEEELERAVLYSATVLHANEQGNAGVATEEQIRSCLEFVFAELQVNPDQNQARLAFICVYTLSAEDEFVESLLRFRVLNPQDKMATEFRVKMREVIAKAANEFLMGTGSSFDRH